MLKQSLRAAAFAAIALSGAAHASYFSTTPNPFPNGSGFVLSAAPNFICISTTECTQSVNISNLQFVTAAPITGGFEETLNATFTASFVDPTNGNAPNGTATLALDAGTHFVVDILDGYNPFTNAIGTFSESLLSASFSGTSSTGHALTASLAGAAAGSVSISSVTGGFNINNSFTINANSTVDGSPVTVPTLGADNTPPPSSVPEPATALLMVPGLLAMAARRRRATAVATAAA